jgi:hypothetical protein
MVYHNIHRRPSQIQSKLYATGIFTVTATLQQ